MEFRLKVIDIIDPLNKIKQNPILLKDPDISERDLIAAVFKRYYQNGFNEMELEKIYQHIINQVEKRLSTCINK